jgi:hypothetical protein
LWTKDYEAGEDQPNPGRPAPVVVGVMNSGQAVTNDTKQGMPLSGILTET